MKQTDVINNIKRVAKATLPPNSSMLLYGSRARGDSREDSDWDLLILLDKSELEADDYVVISKYSNYAFMRVYWMTVMNK